MPRDNSQLLTGQQVERQVTDESLTTAAVHHQTAMSRQGLSPEDMMSVAKTMAKGEGLQGR